MDLELRGKQSFLIEDLSPFQVGTMGKYENKGFILLGRIKLIYDGGMWSEWYAQFDDGTEGWLAEAQGFYMMSFKKELTTQVPALKSMKPGQTVDLNGQNFSVDDIRKVKYAASEGELPFIFEQDYRARSVDFRGGKGLFANLLEGPDGLTFYLGKYLPFNDFSFTNLKAIHGWD